MGVSAESAPKEKVSKYPNYKTLSARELWGKVVLTLREKHFVTLHIMCGDITDVEFDDGGRFLINVTEDFIYDLLNTEDNIKDLKSVFELFGLTNFAVVKKDKYISNMDEDIAKLKGIFGDKFSIKQTKIIN